MTRRPGARRLLGALAVAATVLGAPPAVGTASASVSPASPASCPAAGTRVQITTSTRLDPRCTYGGIDITASHVTLDCRGATIEGDPERGGRGIAVVTPATVALTDVTVRRCRVEGFLNGLRVSRDGFRDLPVGDEFANPTSRIVIEDSSFHGSRGVGIFVDAFASGVTIRRNRIHGAGSSGVYLEAGSRRNRVEGNTIVDNGFRESGPSGQPITFRGLKLWFWGVGREGISVDGSSENVIVGNRFEGNAAGGVFLYKNCGEDAGTPGAWIRRYPASGNRIEANTFRGGRNGVWVGSRMGENTLPMACADPAYVNEGLVRVVLDRADHNVVRANRFTDVTYGVRVEDDHTTVDANWFGGAAPDRHAVVIGTPYRTARLGLPVRGTVLTRNVSTIAGNTHPYRWVEGEADTVARANVALGRFVGTCEGRPLPRQPFIFAIAVAPANPDGTAPPTPDLTVPTVGTLPACG